MENLIVNDVIAVPAGFEVKGIITVARKAGGFGRGGKLEFKIISIKALNEVKISLNYTNYKCGAGDGGYRFKSFAGKSSRRKGRE